MITDFLKGFATMILLQAGLLGAALGVAGIVSTFASIGWVLAAGCVPSILVSCYTGYLMAVEGNNL